MSARRAPSLYGRLSLVLTVLIAVMMTIGAGVWMRETRQAIHEEVEAATRVAEQWLKVLIPETLADAGAAGPAARERLMSHLAAVGRIRANRLEVFAADGQRLYVSPESPYKAGRHAPEWFAGWIAPEVTERQLEADGLSVVLTPDTSRAVLDAWDHLGAALGWAIALLLGIGLATRFAIGRALAPIGDIHNALERGASGRFDQRLPNTPRANSPSSRAATTASPTASTRAWPPMPASSRIRRSRAHCSCASSRSGAQSPANSTTSSDRASPPCVPSPARSSSAPPTGPGSTAARRPSSR